MMVAFVNQVCWRVKLPARIPMAGDWIIAEIVLKQPGKTKTSPPEIVGYSYRLMRVKYVDYRGGVVSAQASKYYGRRNYYAKSSQADIEKPNKAWPLPGELSRHFANYARLHGGQNECPEWNTYDEAVEALISYVELVEDA